MGWANLLYEFLCSNCSTKLRIKPERMWIKGDLVKCPNCNENNTLSNPPVPKIPSALYIGPEKLKRVKILPLPASNVIYNGVGEYHQWFGAGDCHDCPFAVKFPDSYAAPMDCGFSIPDEIQPYSVRSVLMQLSLRKDFPCKYFVQVLGKDDYGNINREEGCMSSCGGCDYRQYLHPCHIANGWIHGEETCPGWEFIAALCQSGNERRFLHQYLRLNHDRESPMPIPQSYIEITERIRIDFVMFVPITRFKWKWLAIEIDSKQFHQDLEKDFQKNILTESKGDEIIRLSAEKQMLEQVRELYHKITNIQSVL